VIAADRTLRVLFTFNHPRLDTWLDEQRKTGLLKRHWSTRAHARARASMQKDVVSSSDPQYGVSR
jgi:hypothetical protein